MDSLRLLRRLDQTTGAIEYRLRRCFEEPARKPAEMKMLHAGIPSWRLGLSGLLEERLPFRDPRLLYAVLALDTGLAGLEEALTGVGEDPGQLARTCFRERLKPVLEEILNRLFEQLGELA